MTKGAHPDWKCFGKNFMLWSFIRKLKLKRQRLKRRPRIMALESLKQHTPLRLHLGCGHEHWKGWINVDISADSAADIVVDFREIKNYFEQGTIDEIVMIHSISYLRLWEARELLTDLWSILKKSGRLILEFPDIAKCAENLIRSEGNIPEYLEAVRGIYAFGMDQITRREKFITYAFGWAAWHIKYELEVAGFSAVQIKDPQTHDQMIWRDTRIEAIK